MDLEKIGKEINALLEEKRKKLKLSFKEDTHTYTMLDNKGNLRSDWISVSGVVENFYENFDAEAKSLSMCDGNVEEQKKLLAKWAEGARVAADMGSRTHYELEIYINKLYNRDKPIRKPIFECASNEVRRSDIMIESGKKFIKTMHDRGAYLLDTELVLGSNTLGYTGQPDKNWLLLNKNKISLIVTDWKTNKPGNFIPKVYTKKMYSPFDYLDSTALGKYNIQLPLYGRLFKDMLKGTKYAEIPIDGYIVVLLLDNGNFEEYRVHKKTYDRILTMDLSNYVIKKEKNSVIL